MTSAELIAYYIALLIIQYASKARARATVEAVVTPVIAEGLLAKIAAAFDLETASGRSLEIMGEYRGIRRGIFGLDLTRTYFEMAQYSEADEALVDGAGFARYGDETVEGFFFRYRDLAMATYDLNDDEMRRLTKLRAAFHGSSLGLGEIDDILFAFFGDDVNLIDGGNMTIEYDGTASADNLFKIAKETGSFPKPAGVAMTITP